MAKRIRAAGDSDIDSQNELDFEGYASDHARPESADDLVPAPDADRPAGRRQIGDESHKAERAIPYTAVPSLTLNPTWDMGPDFAAETRSGMRSFRLRRIAALAAAVAFAAALGGLMGSALTNGFGTAPSADAAKQQPATQAVLARMQQEIAALRTSVETAARDGQMKTTRIAERLDRAERAQAEPMAKLAKISETVERLERRSAQTAAAAATTASADVTGSINARSGGAPAPGPAISTPDSKPANGQVLSGYKLHDVHNGMALIEGSEGVIEVMPGDTLPRIGRVEAIRKQDGRWMVVTSRGLIIDR